MKKKLFLVAVILIAPAKADAASITAMPQANNDEIIDVSITGEIEGGDDDQFYTAIRHIDDKKSVIVNLDSPGGNVVSGLKIGEFINRHGWTTSIPAYPKSCSSICAAIWLAGRLRLATESSLIGFHAAYDAKTKQEKGKPNAILALRFKDWGLDEDAIFSC
jgi:hypothetical protein